MSGRAFDGLKSSFQGDLVVPQDLDYPTAIARWAANAQRAAKVVAFVKDPQDVVLAIKYARDQNLPIAIRGGGHSASGASSSDGGLVIDLSRYLNTVKVDPEKRLGYVGGGAIWETVDKAAINHGLATVGGTVNHTGVGGLLLGGGVGFLSPLHGLAIDNLVQATVVTASGATVTANATENPDLFWGIRGGGCNFGVCTEFVLKLHPQRTTVFAGMVMFPPAALEKVLAAVDQWWKNGPGENEVIASHFSRGPDGKPFLSLFLFYNGPEEEGRATFKYIFDIGPAADTTSEVPYEKLNTFLNQTAVHGKNAYMKSVHTVSPSISIMKDTFETLVEISEPFSLDVHVNLIHEFFPTSAVTRVAKDATAYARRDPIVTVFAFILWAEDTPDRAAFAKRASSQLLKLTTDAEKSIDEKDNVGFGNYYTESDAADLMTRTEKAKALFGHNYPRLQRIKRKYDPELLFSKWFPIFPAAEA